MRLEPIFALHEQKIKSVSTWLTVSSVKHQPEGGFCTEMYMDMFRVSPKTKNVLWILVIDSLLLLLIWLTDSSLDDIKKYKI